MLLLSATLSFAVCSLPFTPAAAELLWTGDTKERSVALLYLLAFLFSVCYSMMEILK
jgi:hypothetical protein